MQFLEASSCEDIPVWNMPQLSQEMALEAGEALAQQTPISNETLTQAKNKLAKFIQTLHLHRKSDLREDVLAHCAQLNKGKKVIPSSISDETIIRMVSSRIDKMLKNRKIKKNWSEQDLKILAWTVSKYADLHCIMDLEKDLTPEDWQKIAQLIPGVTAHSCMFKWLSVKKVNLSVQHWDNYQSSLLRGIVEEQLSRPNMHLNQINWKAVAEKQYKINHQNAKIFRSAKQCREHWNCYLNPQIKKGPWKIEEDIQLLSLIRGNNGDKKWSEIVYSFEGRTQNALKNRYTLLIDKQRKISKSKQEKALIDDCLQRCTQIQAMCTKESRAEFISSIFKEEQKVLEKVEPHMELPQSGQMHQSHRTESQTGSETPSTPVVIKFMKLEEFSFLRQMAISKEVRLGCVKNGKFESAQ